MRMHVRCRSLCPSARPAPVPKPNIPWALPSLLSKVSLARVAPAAPFLPRDSPAPRRPPCDVLPPPPRPPHPSTRPQPRPLLQCGARGSMITTLPQPRPFVSHPLRTRLLFPVKPTQFFPHQFLHFSISHICASLFKGLRSTSPDPSHPSCYRAIARLTAPPFSPSVLLLS